ncbi:hypothetical protein SKAU_G00354160 [Synaphobranchus kaupii]|uniref:Uncharacterized protein n=1 Tax=Synaphobranchus kaupii TaxID=118154 RepID=A0A9Q1EH09_SYNKA|nr:hypothetical protein SKAU_G00354160 [Synaphobranchus kaupii]
MYAYWIKKKETITKQLMLIFPCCQTQAQPPTSSQQNQTPREAEESVPLSQLAQNPTHSQENLMASSPDLKDAILECLPGLPEEALSLLLEVLQYVGVKSKEDLQLVREEDLLDYLSPIQCRRLVNAWKRNEP